MLIPGALYQMATSSSGRSKGSGFSRTPRIRLKIAVLAPMPMPRVTTATAVKNGVRTSRRATRPNRPGNIRMRWLLPLTSLVGRKRERPSSRLEPLDTSARLFRRAAPLRA
jgi:hypothetical protein